MLIHILYSLSIFFSGTQIVPVTCLATPAALRPKGSAARPLDKKKVAILGAAGAMGGLTFGFVQRACSLYGTGLGEYRALGACADTAVRLNTQLSKTFCLAFANEANIKLTDFRSVDAIAAKLKGFDALLFGTDMAIQRRAVTVGTYEKTPNDMCNEIYWKPPSAMIRETEMEKPFVMNILSNVLEGCKVSGIKHICFVDESADSICADFVERTGIPYTRIQPAGELVSLPNYTYRNGIQGNLALYPQQEKQSDPAFEGRCYMEDVAALAVQCLLSLDWNQTRNLVVSASGPAISSAGNKNPKRPDQEWCVNSFLLEQALAGVQ